ncbi:MAG: DUF4157 domain-containing protein [Cyanobacteria bacterium P01_F01_bin.86]
MSLQRKKRPQEDSQPLISTESSRLFDADENEALDTDNLAAESNSTLAIQHNLASQDSFDFGNIALFPETSGQSQLPMQAKLTVGAVNDHYEQEADHVAAHVVETINHPKPDSTAQRKTTNEDTISQRQPVREVQRETADEEEDVQMKPTLQKVGQEGGVASSALEADIQREKTNGSALDSGLQHQMGQVMETDFSNVRIHTNTQADQLNQHLQAKAFTTQNHIFFKRGEYQPNSTDGQELIAHELTHVKQQGASQSQVNRTIQRTIQDQTGVIEDIKAKENRNRVAAYSETLKEAIKAACANSTDEKDATLLKHLDSVVYNAINKYAKSRRSYTAAAAKDKILEQKDDLVSRYRPDPESYGIEPPDTNKQDTHQRAMDLAKLCAVSIGSLKQFSTLTKRLSTKGKNEATGNIEYILRPFPSIKGLDRAAFKSVIKKNGAQYLGDILGSSIIYDSLKDLYQAAGFIKTYLEGGDNNYTVVGFKNRFRDVTAQGYQDMLINIQLPSGHITEVQLHVKAFIEAKKSEGHKYYREERDLSESLDNIEREPIAEMTQEVNQFFEGLKAKYANPDTQKAQIRFEIKQYKRSQGGLNPRFKEILDWYEQKDDLDAMAAAVSNKENRVRHLQEIAKENAYAPAFEKVKEQYAEDKLTNENSEDISWNDFIEKVKNFDLDKPGKKPLQDINRTYQRMYGSAALLGMHEMLFEQAYAEIGNAKDKKVNDPASFYEQLGEFMNEDEFENQADE